MAKKLLIIKIHRWLSLALLLFWLLQALTGVLVSFRWELDDRMLGGAPVDFDLEAFSRRIEQVRADEKYHVHSVWWSGGQRGRYDIYAEEIGMGEVVIRLDGRGEILRRRGESQWLARGGVFDTATNLHATLLAGDAGHWIIGLSGLLLATNIILGLTLAWPRSGQWRRILTGSPRGSAVARLYGWHRLLGLWWGGIGLLVVLLGASLALSEPLEDSLGWGSPVPVSIPASGSTTEVTPGQAIAVALELHPSAEFSGLYPPDEEDPYYTVRLLTKEEPAQKYGNTAVLVDPASGAVLLDQPAAGYPLARRLVNSLFPLHTGQIAGLAGRVLVLFSGIWLLTMLVLGLSLYMKRRAARSGR